MDKTKIRSRHGKSWLKNFVRPLPVTVRFGAYRRTNVYFQYDLWETGNGMDTWSSQ